MASRLHRLLRIIRMVRRPRYPGVQELCQALDVKERTIFNDLKELKELLGVDIRFDRSHGGYYLEGDEWQLTFWGLDEETAVLLLAACQLVSGFAGDVFVSPLKDLFSEEIKRCLMEQWSIKTELKQFITSRFAGVPLDRQIFLELCRASATSQAVRLDMNGAGSVVVCPEGLAFTPLGWEIVHRIGEKPVHTPLLLANVKGCKLSGKRKDEHANE